MIPHKTLFLLIAIFFLDLTLSLPGSCESTPNSVSEQTLEIATGNIKVTPQSSMAEPAQAEVVSEKAASSEELVRSAWDASSKNDLNKINEIVDQSLALYGPDAKLQQQQLVGLPARGEEKNYQHLNDIATILFIRAEALMNNGKTEEAVTEFEKIIRDYPSSQAWDPRGWYWSVKEKSQASINIVTGKVDQETEPKVTIKKRALPKILQKGKVDVVDYSKYGKFINVGADKFHYSIQDLEALKSAVGEGIYPNTDSIYRNPNYLKLKKEGRLEGNHWDFVNTDDLEAAFYKWRLASEPGGVKLFYIGLIFEKAGMYYEALRSYHALIVHFPTTVSWTYWQTPWYPAQVAVAKIRYIIRSHPELNLQVNSMKVKIDNSFDNDIKNDVFTVFPGSITKKEKKSKVDSTETSHMSLGEVKKTVGEGKVRLVQYENGHWQMLVENKPYVIKGITYAPTKIGQSPDKKTLTSWMETDTDNNGQIDGPYQAWVDKNKNNKQDEDEPIVGDFQLMKEMGVNSVRLYHHPMKPNKEVLRKMYEQYGFRVIMGDYLGKYTVGSGASWMDGTDYENPEHRKKMLESVQEMVMEYKDEPYILVWVLGNENNYGVACNADKKPEAYFKFVDEVAQWIKSVDKDHPVAVNNGDTLFLDVFAKNAPNIDIFTANVYRGDYGFGSFWEEVANGSGKPAFITEYGCPAYVPHLTTEASEDAQAAYHLGNWMDIEDNLASNAIGSGNALGGIVFEWLDEWWKSYEPFLHDKKSDAVGPFPGGFYFEEWFGIISQGNGQHSPFMRQLRKSYHLYKELWNK